MPVTLIYDVKQLSPKDSRKGKKKKRKNSRVYKNRKIKANEFSIEFTVKCWGKGCYAIEVILFEVDSLTFNDTLGISKKPLNCYCFGSKESKIFHIGGLNNKHKNDPYDMPSPKSINLGNLVGRWPSSDGYFDNTLEVRAQINLYRCKGNKCDGRSKDLCAVKLDDTEFNDDDIIKKHITPLVELDLANGTGWNEAWEDGKDGASAVRSLLSRNDSFLPKSQLIALKTLSRKVKRLERKLDEKA